MTKQIEDCSEILKRCYTKVNHSRRIDWDMLMAALKDAWEKGYAACQEKWVVEKMEGKTPTLIHLKERHDEKYEQNETGNAAIIWSCFAFRLCREFVHPYRSRFCMRQRG